jgi:PHD/YefM family antitoxin component YafN of YafNO toxin-antitoxin module
MTITTMSGREFNQDSSRAKRAAKHGPVIITERGRPAHVLMTIEDYRKLTGGETPLSRAVEQVDEGDFAFEPPRIEGVFHGADLG